MEVLSTNYFGVDVTPFNIYPTQYDGIRYLEFIESLIEDPRYFKGAILADDMGLGKTRQSIGLCEVSLVPKTLIICTKSTLYAWFREALSTAKRCDILTINDSLFCRVSLDKDDEIKITKNVGEDKNIYPVARSSILIINYDILPNCIKKINTFEWDRIIADEAHVLRNGENTNFFKFAVSIKQPFKNGNRIGTRIAVTGTPIENNIDDIISIFKWIDDRFKISNDDLKIMIRMYLFRRNKDQINDELKIVMKYPKKKPDFFYVNLTLEETELSRKLESLSIDEIKQFFNLNRYEIKNLINDERSFYIVMSNIYMNTDLNKAGAQLAQTSNLRESLSCPYSDKISFLNNIEYQGKSVKIDAVLKILENENDNFVIFHRYIKSGQKLAEKIKEKFPNYHISQINGQTTNDNRDSILIKNKKLIENNEKSVKSVLISSIQSTCEGVNYQFYSKMIIFDQEWNPKNELQAVHRLYRIGQNKKVKVWILINESFKIKNHVIGMDDRIKQVKDEKDPQSLIIEDHNAAFFFRRLYWRNSKNNLVPGSFFGSEFEKRRGYEDGPDSVGPLQLITY